MRIIILAAGYATQLYPLTLTRPKPLLTVADRPIIERVLNNLSPLENVTHVYLVTNDKFNGAFHDWVGGHPVGPGGRNIEIINDGSTSDSNRLGAVRDLLLVLDSQNVDDDILVVAGDNLFNKPLGDFGRFCLEKNAPVLGVYDVQRLDQARKYGVISLDKEQRIRTFEEKPQNPSSTYIGIALYYYPRHVLPLIRQFVEEGNDADRPGELVEWMYQRTPFYAWEVPGIWYDIGSKETLEEANRIFRQNP